MRLAGFLGYQRGGRLVSGTAGVYAGNAEEISSKEGPLSGGRGNICGGGGWVTSS